MPYDFDTPIDRIVSGSLKWGHYAGRDVLPFWVADMDFPAPAPVREALQQFIAHGDLGYALPSATLVGTVLTMLEQRYNWRVQPEWLLWMPSAVTALNLVCRACTDDGGSALVPTPIYPPFLSAPTLSGLDAIRVPHTLRDGEWILDPQTLAEAARPDTRVLLYCNPQNPTGRVFSREEQRAIAEVCLSRDIVICSDELHCDLVLDTDKEHIPMATLSPEIAEQTVAIYAPSKGYNVNGLFSTFMVVPGRVLRHKLKKARMGIVPYVNVLGHLATEVAYRDCGPWRAALHDYLRTNRAYIEEFVKTSLPGCRMAHPEATFLAWIDCRETGIENPHRFFEEHGVGLSNGREFGMDGFVRFNFACPHALMQQGLVRMRGALQSVF